jgi:tRNA threonylcarbamoyladenosine biosynthesis protein TsaE
VARNIGQHLRGGEVIELTSDLGGGKTAFVRGLAQGAGSSDVVSSPSFTLTNQYQAGELTLQHFDFYRLQEPGIMRDELAEILTEPKFVTIVEWAGIVADVLPADRLTISITVSGEDSRQFTVTYPDELEYLIESIAA